MDVLRRKSRKKIKVSPEPFIVGDAVLSFTAAALHKGNKFGGHYVCASKYSANRWVIYNDTEIEQCLTDDAMNRLNIHTDGFSPVVFWLKLSYQNELIEVNNDEQDIEAKRAKVNGELIEVNDELIEENNQNELIEVNNDEQDIEAKINNDEQDIGAKVNGELIEVNDELIEENNQNELIEVNNDEQDI
eukprot:193981_1